MHGPNAPAYGPAELTLDATEAANPEWGPWLRLLRRTRSAQRAAWTLDVGLAATRTDDAPLLHDGAIAIDEPHLRGWLSELVLMAHEESDDREAFGDLVRHIDDALGLLTAAIALDTEALDAMAMAHQCEPARLGAILQLAAMPVLTACRRRVAGELPRGWSHGYCALCGAWPAFAEVRGLERERRARCGRCAFEWRFDVLRCPYCDERDHQRLGGLVIEGDETRRLDTCRTCGGYLKSLTTLLAVPDDRIGIRDVETLELDLVAAERGFTRPAERAFPLDVTLVPRDRRETLEDGRAWFLA